MESLTAVKDLMYKLDQVGLPPLFLIFVKICPSFLQQQNFYGNLSGKWQLPSTYSCLLFHKNALFKT